LAPGNFNDIATFVSVVRAGSFTSAAQQLGITRSAVGKIIARLETRLQVRLLHRTPQSLGLTDDGAVYFARCTQLLEDLEETETAMAVRSATPTGTLRISVPIALGHRQVLPVIESFLESWPAVTAEVSFTDRFIDLVDEGFDIASPGRRAQTGLPPDRAHRSDTEAADLRFAGLPRKARHTRRAIRPDKS
jgi:DNA-binding transcriptional LysR family regulator